MQRAIVSPRLIGREDHLAMIRAAYERSRSDRTATVVVSGEAGIGKSRLVEEAVGDLPGGPLVLAGGCFELGTGGVSYAAFTTMLRRLCRQLGQEPGEAAMGPAQTEWLAGSAAGEPEYDGSAGFLIHESAAGRSRLLREFVAMVGRLSQTRPTVLIVEDLHWADEASRDLFIHLARNLPGPGLLLIGTIRTGELGPEHPVRQLLGELRRRSEVEALELQPLSRTEVGAQLRALTGRPVDPWFATVIHRRSGGNPLFVESLSETTDFAATSLRQLLLERVVRLPAEVRRLLAVIAVSRSRVSDAVLRVVSGQPDEAVSAGLRTLLEHGQIIAADDGYTLRHDLIREAVYTDLLPAERRQLHRRFAEALMSVGDMTVPDRLPELALHWAAAGVPREALIAAWEASWVLHKRTAFSEELRQLETVLDHWDSVDDAPSLIGTERVDVLERAVLAAIAGGPSERGLVHAGEALAVLDAGADPARRAALLCLQARLLNRTDAGGQEAMRTLPIARATYELADKLGLRRTRGSLPGMMTANCLYTLGHWTEAEQLLDDILTEDLPPLFGASVRGFRALVAASRGDLPLVRELVEASHKVAAQGRLATRFLIYTQLAQLELDLLLGDPEAADQSLEQLLAVRDNWVPADAFQVALDGLWVQTARQAATPRNQAVRRRIADRRTLLLELAEAQGVPSDGHAPYMLTIRAAAGSGRMADWDRATEAWLGNRNAYQAARTLTSGAAAALSCSNRAGAASRLRRAQEIAGQLEARPLLSAITDLAVRAGLDDAAPDPDECPARRYGLTAREREVLRVLARGLTNRQIAAELYLSPNTVGVHIARIFTKLNVNSRAEATALAHRAGFASTRRTHVPRRM